jgi:L-fuculose-phosphate aldolase
MKSEHEHKQEIVEIGRRLYGDGNISVRLEDGILTTPRSVCKGFLNPDMLVKVSPEGKKISGTHEASSELSMHMLIYNERPDVRAVVHAHPPCGTGYAAAGLALDKALISEVILTLGCIPLAGYGTPSTEELTDSMRPLVKHHDALLMANHGAVAYGPTLDTAHGRMETLEHFARISLVAKLLGRQRELSNDDVRKLIDLRERHGYMSKEMRCQACGYNPAGSCNDEQPQTSTSIEWNDDLITLTRSELIELVKQASRLTRNGIH